MLDSALVELARDLGARVMVNEPLAPHTTFRIGGPAALFLRANTLAELVQHAHLARTRHVPIFILGNGSNILVRDGGIRALVIENHCARFSLDVINSTHAILSTESGVSLPLVANKMARAGWAGLEWAIGVPGTIGAAIAGNAGAHGGSIADNLVSVTILDSQGVTRQVQNAELGFQYRSSCFKGDQDTIILQAAFRLLKEDPNVCIGRMNTYTEHRRRTQPTEASVGSIFKNPPGNYAGKLIEQAGLKGMRFGNVEVSNVHANFFVNRGGGKAKDVLALIEIVRARVREKFGVDLELEIQVVGVDVLPSSKPLPSRGRGLE